MNRRTLLSMGMVLMMIPLCGAMLVSERIHLDLDAVGPHASAHVRFEAVEIWLDSKDQPLAAYQLEFKPAAGNVKIVGIEGGEHPQFANPPYYDPAAMQQERVIIAAFSTVAADQLPVGRTRIATIHVQVGGNVPAEFDVRPMAMATVNGAPINVNIETQRPSMKQDQTNE